MLDLGPELGSATAGGSGRFKDKKFAARTTVSKLSAATSTGHALRTSVSIKPARAPVNLTGRMCREYMI